MRTLVRIGVFMLYVTLAGSAFAGGDLTSQTETAVTVSLGTKDDKIAFEPNKLAFETGKLYKLVLHNPSKHPHYFSSEALARSVFTRKVQVLSDKGVTIAEIKGVIYEIEVMPGGTAEWFFVPVKTLKNGALKCTIAGHEQGGMVGTIDIQ
jgi:uncharacterized cupredoxin-like copper-binding protein